MKKLLIFIIFSLISLNTFSQGLAFEVGYKNKGNHNMNTGLSYRIDDKETWGWVNVNTTYTTNFKNNHIFPVGVHFATLFLETGVDVSN